MIWSLWVPQLPVFVHPVVNRCVWMCVNAYPHHRPEMGRDCDRLDVPEFEYYKVYVGGKVLNLSRE